MKKLLLVLISAVFLFGCSSSDDNSSSNTSFNPPSWIQGRWMAESTGVSGYRFTNNDVKSVIMTTEFSFGEQIKSVNNVGGKTSINEEIKTNTEYKFSYTLQSATQYYHFIKVSNTKFKDALNDPNGYNLYTKQ